MSGSGNHYSRQVQHLEALVTSKMKQVSLLEKEHQLLRHKESALQNAIHSIEGPLALVKHSLAALTPSPQHEPWQQQPAAPAAAAAATAQAQPAGSMISWGSSTHSQGGVCSPATSSDADGIATERSGSSVTSTATGLTAATYKGGMALLQQLNKKEGKVQHVLQQLGYCDSAGYKQLYTTQLLRSAVADPARMAGYLNMAKPERLRYWSQAYSSMALLLGKYDSNVSTAAGNVRDQMDHLVDELMERVVVCALLDPPQKHMSCFMFNVDTHEFEQYPEGWWRQVAEGMQLSTQDKAALKLVWDRVQVGIQQLTLEWEQLQQQLQHMHMLQLQSNKKFEKAIKELPSLLHTLTMAEQARQQEKRAQEQQQRQCQQQSPLPYMGQSMGANPPLQQPQPYMGQPMGATPPQQQQQPMAPPPPRPPGCQQQQQQPGGMLPEEPLLELHSCWRQESLLTGPRVAGLVPQGPAAAADDELADLFIAELAAELEQEQQLEQQVNCLMQQQQGGWGGGFVSTVLPAAAGAGACGGMSNGMADVFMQQAPQLQYAPACTAAGGGSWSVALGPPAAAASTPPLYHGQQEAPIQFVPACTAAGAGGNWNDALGPPTAASTPPAHPSPQAATASPQSAERVLSQDPFGDAHSGSFARPVSVPPATPDGAFTKLDEAEEVLLQDGSEERQQLERRVLGTTNKMKVLHFCLVLQVTNCLSKKQLAAMCVHSAPFVFDVEMICKALDQMGWE